MHYFLLFFLTFIAQPAFAQTDYFPYKIGPDGQILAPFADPVANQKSGDPLEDLYDPTGGSPAGGTKTHTPHRSIGQLANWAGEQLIEALSFTDQNIEQQMQKVRPAFTEAGWRAYTNFLQNQYFFKALSQNTPYQISSFTPQTAEIRGQGVQDSQYKWAYEVPVTLYHGAPEGQSTQENYTFIIQITRIPNDPLLGQDVQIEYFSVKPTD